MTFAASALAGIDFGLAFLHWQSVAVLELFYPSERQVLLELELEPHKRFRKTWNNWDIRSGGTRIVQDNKSFLMVRIQQNFALYFF